MDGGRVNERWVEDGKEGKDVLVKVVSSVRFSHESDLVSVV
jgi:hypothetical protein